MKGYGLKPNGNVYRYMDSLYLQGKKEIQKLYNKYYKKLAKKRARLENKKLERNFKDD